MLSDEFRSKNGIFMDGPSDGDDVLNRKGKSGKKVKPETELPGFLFNLRGLLHRAREPLAWVFRETPCL